MSLISSLVLIEYENIRIYVLLYSLSFLVLCLIIDAAAFATKEHFFVWYGPLLLETFLYSLGIVALYLRLPEAYFKNSRIAWLYCSSQVIYHVLLINFLFELQVIIHNTIKWNRGDLLNPKIWWNLPYIYH